jgi:hypothetical protein
MKTTGKRANSPQSSPQAEFHEAPFPTGPAATAKKPLENHLVQASNDAMESAAPTTHQRRKHIGTYILLLGVGLGLCTGCRETRPLNESGLVKQASVGTNDVMVGNRVGPSPDGSNTSLRIEWYVPRRILEKQPRWDPLRNEPPPLSVAKASLLALSEPRQRFPEVKEWLVQEVELSNVARYLNEISDSYPDVWVYRFSFKPRDPQVLDRMGSRFWNDPVLEQIVLFDGSVVVPRITTE